MSIRGTLKILKITTVVLFYFTTKSYSQFQIGGHGNIVIPTGPLSKYSDIGVGAGLTLRYIFAESTMGVGMSGDYFSLSPKNSFGKSNDGIYYSSIPVTFHFIYNFLLQTPFIRPYAAFNIGIYNENMSAESWKFGPDAFRDLKKLSFGLAPEGGISVKISDIVRFDLGTKINLIANGVIPKNYGKVKDVGLSGSTSFITFYGGLSYTFP